jgi:hypothetical protein
MLEYIQERPDELTLILTESKLLAADWNTKFMNAAGFILGLERVMGEMVYQMWFDKKDKAISANFAYACKGKIAQLPNTQENPSNPLMSLSYADEKGISYNIMNISHPQSSQMERMPLAHNSPAQILEWSKTCSALSGYLRDMAEAKMQKTPFGLFKPLIQETWALLDPRET